MTSKKQAKKAEAVFMANKTTALSGKDGVNNRVGTVEKVANTDEMQEVWGELDGKGSLLERYLLSGWLEKKYVVETAYVQPYSAQDRYLAGQRFYQDYLYWSKGMLAAKNYEIPKVDGGRMEHYHWMERPQAEPFRKVLRTLSKSVVPILYKIVIEERDILAPKNLTERERSYFNHEIKVMLCRGLDELSSYYKLSNLSV